MKRTQATSASPSLASTWTEIHAAQQSTLTEIQRQRPGKGREQLIANYKALLKEQAIFYPVAYRFAKRVGRGRQATVFLAHRQGARGCLTKHAIKVFDPSIYANAKKYWTDMGRIATQTSVLADIRSPHLVSLDIYEEINGIGYLQMEHIRGHDLRYLLSARHLPRVKKAVTPEQYERYTSQVFRVDDGVLSIQPGVAVYILRMMLKGLESLHEAGFLHSDLKPSNVMINRLGYVKLVDFGRATKPDETMRLLLGSPMYMAPEMHRRESGHMPSDLYGVGMVALELLRGRALIEEESLDEQKLLDLKMKLPERLNDMLPDHVRANKELTHILRKLTHPDPKQRYSSAAEAEGGEEGLRLVHTQLVKTNQDADYARIMGEYMTDLLMVEEE